MKNPIAIIDSGSGGTHILAHCARLMPHQDFVYLADTFNAPFGAKPHFEIVKIAENLVQFSIEKFNPKIIVFACNTLTVNAVKKMRKKFPQITFVGVEPALKQAQIYGGSTIVFATNSTQKFFGKLKVKVRVQLRQEYRKQGLRYVSPGKIFRVSSATLAKQIDENLDNLDALMPTLKNIFSKPKYLACQNLVLGCTHYLALKAQIQKILPNIKMFDGALAVAKQVQKFAPAKSAGTQKITFITTDGNNNFKQKFEKYFEKIK
ncbi:MAG: aspartate/glutamate racemase family protein [Clostridia bacterium]|nr:aspartate/glutamate racemase family protein [Clostridia bacterium]